MLKVPEKIAPLLAAGDKKLAEERRRREKHQARERRRQHNDPERRRQKRWLFLCAEAQIDLGALAAYANFNMPSQWDCEGEHHWFFLNVPGLAELVAEYARYKDGYEWHLSRWGVACYLDGGRANKFWVAHSCLEKSVEYVLALARESYAHKTFLEARRTLKGGQSEIITHEAPIHRIAEVEMEEIHGEGWDQVVS